MHRMIRRDCALVFCGLCGDVVTRLDADDAPTPRYRVSTLPDGRAVWRLGRVLRLLVHACPESFSVVAAAEALLS